MPKKEHLFVSDVHLGAFSPAKEAEVENELIALIDYAIDNRAKLYILGDLFDYWMEYPDSGYVPKVGEEVLDKFEKYNHTIEPAVYVTGNHDNWNFGHFEKRGFDVEPRFRIITIEDQKVLIMHGDGRVGERDDILRPAFHKILRHPSFTGFYQKVFPPKNGLRIMKAFSNLTRKRNYRNPDPLNKHAQRILNSKEIDMVICGHDHLPRMETFSGGSYINSGTFFDHKTLVQYTDNQFRLVSWSAKSKEFVLYGSNNPQQ